MPGLFALVPIPTGTGAVSAPTRNWRPWIIVEMALINSRALASMHLEHLLQQQQPWTQFSHTKISNTFNRMSFMKIVNYAVFSTQPTSLLSVKWFCIVSRNSTLKSARLSIGFTTKSSCVQTAYGKTMPTTKVWLLAILFPFFCFILYFKLKIRKVPFWAPPEYEVSLVQRPRMDSILDRWTSDTSYSGRFQQ